MLQIVPNPPFRRLLARFVPLAVCLLGSLLASGASGSEKYALLIGVTKYGHARMNEPPLKFPEADVEAVAALLRESGFEVKTLRGREATRAAILTELDQARRQGSSDGVLVIGLFGHGVQYGDEAYFGPYDTSVDFVTDSQGNRLRDERGQPRLEPDEATMVSMRGILDTLSASGAGSRVLLADCCRDDPSRARGRAFGSNLRVADLPPRTAALFACSANERAFEHDDWGHGAFTKSLLERCDAASAELTANELSVSLFRDVSQKVRGKTNGREKQTVHAITNGIVELGLRGKSRSNLASSNDAPPVVVSPVEPPVDSPRVTSRSAGDETSDNGLSLKLCWIPAGSFTMGSPPSERNRDDDEWQVEVTLSRGFWLGKYEVTQAEWRRVMGSSPWQGENWVKEGDLFPATYVSWEDAKAYCAKLTEQERQAGRLSASEEYRLPTEAEWEYACRSGAIASYSFGNDSRKLGEYAWFRGNADSIGEEYAHEVGQKRPNNWGVHDMHGNVWEWCEDVYAERLAGGTDPLGSQAGSSRVFRGGSWLYDLQGCRAAYRGKNSPGFRSYSQGFRVVRSSVE